MNKSKTQNSPGARHAVLAYLTARSAVSLLPKRHPHVLIAVKTWQLNNHWKSMPPTEGTASEI
jgi:hypothetical protein